MAWISRLHDTALALAVYASDTSVARRSRKTRFPLLASSTGWDWLPTGFDRKVSHDVSTSSSPFPRLRLAQHTLHAAANRLAG